MKALHISYGSISHLNNHIGNINFDCLDYFRAQSSKAKQEIYAAHGQRQEFGCFVVVHSLYENWAQSAQRP